MQRDMSTNKSGWITLTSGSKSMESKGHEIAYCLDIRYTLVIDITFVQEILNMVNLNDLKEKLRLA